MKAFDCEDILKEKPADPEFHRAYGESEEKFAVAKEVIRLRVAKGWTQRELTEHAHTSQPAIARLQSGNYRNVSLMFLRKHGLGN